MQTVTKFLYDEPDVGFLVHPGMAAGNVVDLNTPTREVAPTVQRIILFLLTVVGGAEQRDATWVRFGNVLCTSHKVGRARVSQRCQGTRLQARIPRFAPDHFTGLALHAPEKTIEFVLGPCGAETIDMICDLCPEPLDCSHSESDNP